MEGYLPGYVVTPKDVQMRNIYREWVRANYGNNLNGLVYNDGVWKNWLHYLAVIPSNRYYSLGGKVGRKFVW